jgi:hypothetical protein
MKKAFVKFSNGTSSVVVVNSSYSRGGVHYYSITLNSGETKLFTGEDVSSLTYLMG